jgi:hypothetical protein
MWHGRPPAVSLRVKRVPLAALTTGIQWTSTAKSWQAPAVLTRMMTDPDTAKAGRAMQAPRPPWSRALSS